MYLQQFIEKLEKEVKEVVPKKKIYGDRILIQPEIDTPKQELEKLVKSDQGPQIFLKEVQKVLGVGKLPEDLADVKVGDYVHIGNVNRADEEVIIEGVHYYVYKSYRIIAK